MTIIDIKTADEYKNIIQDQKPSVVLFGADWAEQCKQVTEVFEELNTLLSEKLKFVNISAEDFPEISKTHQIEAVPTIIFFNNGTAVDRVDGVDIAALTLKCKKIAATTSNTALTLNDRLKELVNKAAVMIFMKGDRNAPRCGFSKELISIINNTSIAYDTFDILTDEDVRQGLKTYSDWPTYPQVYVKGELIGGLDIIKELQLTNELNSALSPK